MKARTKWIWIILSAIVAALILNAIFRLVPWPWTPNPAAVPEETVAAPDVAPEPLSPPEPAPVIDYDVLKEGTDPTLNDLVDQRKQDFGLKESVDMVANRNETIKIGNESISVKEILDLLPADSSPTPAATHQTGGEGTEGAEPGTSPQAEGAASVGGTRTSATSRRPEDFYAFHVVTKGENLWSIHFAMLREYLNRRGFDVGENADKRTAEGSSPVARILKYAESMVHVFNIKTKTLDPDFQKLKPGEKLVVFNISQLDRFLGGIEPGELSRVRFDGDRLYLAEDAKPSAPPHTP